MTDNTPIIPSDEAVDLLRRVMQKDVVIEALQWQVMEAKTAYDLAKAELKDAVKDRDKLSIEIRNPPPLFPGQVEFGDLNVPLDPATLPVLVSATGMNGKSRRGRKPKAPSEVAN